MSDEPQRATAAQVAHVENEIEVRAANIVSNPLNPTRPACMLNIIVENKWLDFHPFARFVQLRLSLS